MGSMLTAKTAKFFKLQPVRMLFLVLGAGVILTFTLGAFKLYIFTHGLKISALCVRAPDRS